MQSQISPDLTLSYHRVGLGRPLVFLHAFPLSDAMWSAQAAHFSPDFDVVMPNSRGIGESSSFSSTHSIEILADDLALLLDHLQIKERVILCGLSMGGYIALEFVRKYGDRIAALVLADTRADADSDEGKKARDEMIAFAKTNDGRAVAQRMLPKLLGETTRNYRSELAGAVEAIAAENQGLALANLMAAMRDRRDSTSILGRMKVPTLVLGGGEDVVSTPEMMMSMANQIPGASYQRIEKSGHLSNLEMPEEFNEIVSDFLKGLAL